MEFLKQLYRINSKSGNEKELKSLLWSRLSELDVRVEGDAFGNVYVTKGIASSYPCVAAHLDEVHLPVQRTIVFSEGVLRAEDGDGQPVGCGADDKNGIWVAMRLLAALPVLKVVFFVQEEKEGEIAGCRGSNACNLAFFDDCRYIIECDRKGCSDVVVYSEKAGVTLSEPEFWPADVLARYGFQAVHGGKTDVVALRMRGLSIPCCNVSCGYYEAHTANEYTVWEELERCADFVQAILMKI